MGTKCNSNKKLDKETPSAEEVLQSIKDLKKYKTSEELIKSSNNLRPQKKQGFSIIRNDNCDILNLIKQSDVTPLTYEIISQILFDLGSVCVSVNLYDIITLYKIECNEISKLNDLIFLSNFNIIRENLFVLDNTHMLSHSFLNYNIGELTENSSILSKSQIVRELGEDELIDERTGFNHDEMLRVFKNDNNKNLKGNGIKALNKTKVKKGVSIIKPLSLNKKLRTASLNMPNVPNSMQTGKSISKKSLGRIMSPSLGLISEGKKSVKKSINPFNSEKVINITKFKEKTSKQKSSSITLKKSNKSITKIDSKERNIDDILLDNLIILSENDDRFSTDSNIPLSNRKIKKNKNKGSNNNKNLGDGTSRLGSPLSSPQFLQADAIQRLVHPIKVRRKGSKEYEDTLVNVIKHKISIDIRKIDEDLEKQKSEALLMKSTISCARKNKSLTKVDLTKVSK